MCIVASSSNFTPTDLVACFFVFDSTEMEVHLASNTMEKAMI